jgi:acyl CoA:acetate/3-ketoacid CoA transferase
LIVRKAGALKKLVASVVQITFSGKQALLQGQQVLYVTERAVFRLTEKGVELIEIAPGIELQRDVLDGMGFTPVMEKPPVVMPAAYFTGALHGFA